MLDAESLIPMKKPSDTTTNFIVKDSGKRESYNSGMVRDTAEGKNRPDLIRDGPMFQRWIHHLTNGAKKYDPRNWMKASGKEEFDRFLESTDRHYNIWYTWRRYGINIEDPDNPTTNPPVEDHAAGVYFNINCTEYTAEKLHDQEHRRRECGLSTQVPHNNGNEGDWDFAQNTVSPLETDTHHYLPRFCPPFIKQDEGELAERRNIESVLNEIHGLLI